jgi:hypothetical protein
VVVEEVLDGVVREGRGDLSEALVVRHDDRLLPVRAPAHPGDGRGEEVQVLLPRDPPEAVIVYVPAGISSPRRRFVRRLRDGDLHTADHVRQLGERGEVDDGDVVDPDPVSPSIVCTRSVGPPWENAALILAPPWPGIGTHLSHGKDMPYSSSRVAGMCTSMIDSVRWAPAGHCEGSPTEIRLSEPRNRMF